jgi:hypothetical protein
MKHFSKKNLFRGAGGGKPKVEPAILRPPKVGKFQIANSYSIVEITDLISDGPIEGLVNQDGLALNQSDILQGIYLDNTPIEATTRTSAQNNSSILFTYSDYVGNISYLSSILRPIYLLNYTQGGQVIRKWPCYMGTPSDLGFFCWSRPRVTTKPVSPQWPQFSLLDYGSVPITVDRDGLRPFATNLNIENNKINHDDLTSSTESYLNNQANQQANSLWYLANQTLNGKSSAGARVTFTKSTNILQFIRNTSYINDNTEVLNPCFSNGEKIAFTSIGSAKGIQTYKAYYVIDQTSSSFRISESQGGAAVSITASGEGGLIYMSPKPTSANPYYSFYQKDQITANTNLEIHFYNQKELSTLTLENTIFSEYKTRLQNLINISTNSNYVKYLALLQKKLNSVESTYIGQRQGIGNKPYTPSNEIFTIVKIGTYSTDASLGTPVNFSLGGNTNKVINEYTKLFVLDLKNKLYLRNDQLINLLIPEVDSSNNLTGKFHGLIIIKMDLEFSFKKEDGVIDHHFWNFDKEIEDFGTKNLEIQILEDEDKKELKRKFNFGNVLCEFRKGLGNQVPLRYFNNIYVDYEYNSQLFGPFRKIGNVLRIKADNASILDTNASTIKNDIGIGTNTSGGFPTLDENDTDKEGSNDYRDTNGVLDYANWNNDNQYDEKAIPLIHTIENPNVSKVSFSLVISQLKDTLSKDLDEDLKAGDSYPAILAIEVEWGKVENGSYSNVNSKEFFIICQVQGQMILDFGMPNYSSPNTNDGRSYVQPSDSYEPFILPDLNENDDVSKVKRYLKITKASTETNSILIKREVGVAKITEIIENNLSYPYSSIAGIKVDARSFGSVPDRSYDCRLKKIKIPSNYFPLDNKIGGDKRYVSKSSSYTNKNQIYIGDWNGVFIEGWTDNPAWILYDMLTSKRYGLGGYIDESQINIWELYKIGRFCDAVDDNGYFEGVSDGVGGLEPRYSCNVMFKDQIKLFDAINTIASLFRGIVFFSNSEIHFLDDRPRIPISFFSNANVKDGVFNYTNNRRDQQYNTIEVSYLDRFDNFKTKVEYIEDESDIRKRGVFKSSINTMGVTSRAMARRIGQHIIYETIKENQGIEFKAGLESLLCRPGDLIIVEDEMKTRSTNYGKILSVDLINKIVKIENEYDNDNYTGKLTVYAPTGFATNEEMSTLARLNRSRVEYFDLTGVVSPVTSFLTGRYSFSGYLNAYPKSSEIFINTSNLPYQVPFYTGKNSNGQNLFCYFNTGATGFVFSTGLAFQDNDTYDKLILNTGVYAINEVYDITNAAKSLVFNYQKTNPIKRGLLSTNITGLIYTPKSTNGILNEEISLINNPQIATFYVTGYDNTNYGSNLYLDQTQSNTNLLAFVKAGSAYRIERKNSQDQIYKINTIREENQNEYTILGTKFNTGKFIEIEGFKSEDFLPDTYYSGPLSTNAVVIEQLAAPVIAEFKTGVPTATKFSLSGRWSRIPSAVGYFASLYNSITQEYSGVSITSNNTTGYLWTNMDQLGKWELAVNAVGNKTTSLDSEFARSGIFVMYQGVTKYEKAPIIKFSVT